MDSERFFALWSSALRALIRPYAKAWRSLIEASRLQSIQEVGLAPAHVSFGGVAPT
jgi:hypothetical protein